MLDSARAAAESVFSEHERVRRIEANNQAIQNAIRDSASAVDNRIFPFTDLVNTLKERLPTEIGDQIFLDKSPNNAGTGSGYLRLRYGPDENPLSAEEFFRGVRREEGQQLACWTVRTPSLKDHYYDKALGGAAQLEFFVGENWHQKSASEILGKAAAYLGTKIPQYAGIIDDTFREVAARHDNGLAPNQPPTRIGELAYNQP